MLDFAIFAVTFVVFLVGLLIYIYPSSNKKTTIPGLQPSNSTDGNLADIGRAGSLHQFLLDLHKDHGPLASFYMGPELVVSIGTPELMKEISHLFDRPVSLFKLFEPLIGAECVQYANHEDGRIRRKLYDPGFSHESMKHYWPIFTSVSKSLAKTWLSTPRDQHVPVNTHVMAFAIKVIIKALFGKTFKSDKEVLEFRRHYDLCWGEMESTLTEGPAAPGSERDRTFKESRDYLHNTCSKALQERKNNPPGADDEDHIFLDTLLESDLPDKVKALDALVMVIGGFHTTGNLITWMLYFLSTRSDVQEKLVDELEAVLGDDEITPDNINDLRYTRRVIDETLRCAVIAPWGARFSERDLTIAGHTVPAKTPIITAFGVMLQDERLWADPTRFDPDRFLPENMNQLPPHAFEPFGYVGKRKCPGYRFSYCEVLVFCACVLRKVKIVAVEDQVIKPVHGLVTHPSDEVWVTVEKRT